MISGKDITIDKDGNIILNGDKYPLASQAEIDAVKDDIDDIEEKLEKTFTLDAGTVIPNNSDLNDYKTPGNYYHLTADVGTISNIPINKGFKLTVLLDLKDVAFVEQLFNPIGTYTLYKRYLSSGTTWSNWVIVEDNLSDLIKTQDVEETITTMAGDSDTAVNIALTVPTGYKPIGATDAIASTRNVAVTGTWINAENSTLIINCANIYNVSVSDVTVAATVLYVKS